MLEEIAETLRGGRLEDPRELICRTIACKAAIKAGRRSDPQELAVLAEKVASGEIRYCPHGRPVCGRLTKTERDRQFKRIV
jgi:DNA mismatch repair protein MutL